MGSENVVLVQTRITETQRQAMKDMAHREGLSVAALMRRIIVEAIEGRSQKLTDKIREVVREELMARKEWTGG